MLIGKIAYRKLSQNVADQNGINSGVNSKKDASQNELRNAWKYCRKAVLNA